MLLSGGLILLTLGASAVAGDLLRGGYWSNSAHSSTPGSFTTPAVSQARANMQDALARATQSIQAIQRMQSAARKIASGYNANNAGINPNNPSQQLPNVPNGLGIGGLDPATGATAGSSLWSGAGLPAQSIVNGRTQVTVDQTSPDAVLTWQSFSIGRSTTLDFEQAKTGATTGDSIVFNIIQDPGGVPSQILGVIQAQGQVYVINQNGIIFGGGSQVNVHTLVASSLPINTNLINRGLLNNPDDQFLFSQLPIPAGTNGPTPAFTPPAPVNGVDGDVTVQAGAQIQAADTSDNVGGRVALIGPNVTNAGTISTPDGQTILAAGNQVGFLASSSASLRGLDTYIGAVDASSGDATNTGLIEVPRGDTTIAGEDVNQLGVIASTTSVTLNGRIDLDASYGTKVVAAASNTDLFVPTDSGNVTLGANSETQILPEWDSTETVVGTTLALPSEVEIEGETIHLETNSQILAPSANVALSAGDWSQSGDSPAQFVPSKGQVYLDAGASIDVAGSIVSAPVSENIVSAQLLGPELANSPLQRNGVLYGQTVEVDARDMGIYDGIEWVGTPLANVSGYVDLIQRPVGELTTAGGSVSLTAGGSVVMQHGSDIDVSGGAINYQGGTVQTTDLIYDGQIVNIAQAIPDVAYQGILGSFTVDYAKWGIQQTYNIPLLGGAHYEDSYVEGGNGGSISIAAPAVALDGALLGRTYPGSRQLQVPPALSSITLSFQMQSAASDTSLSSPTPPQVLFADDSALPAAPAFALDSSGDPIALPAARQAEVVLSPDLLTTDGFGSLTVNNGDGDIALPAGVALTAPAFGSITLVAANLDIEGAISAPDGSLDFTVYDYSPYAWLSYSPFNPPPTPDSSRGHFVLGSGASLSTAGLIIDDEYLSPTAYTQPVATGGGSITIASYSADLAVGSTINVSGGAVAGPTDKLTYGNGGTISIAAGQDPESAATLGGTLILDATLKGYSGGTGGSLSILAPAIQIGGSVTANANSLLLDPSFFSQGGFASFTLTGLGGTTANSASTFDYLPAIYIAPGTVIAPVAENWIGFPNSQSPDGITEMLEVLPEAQRTPVNLSFLAPGIKDLQEDQIIRGDFVMGAGATITTDALGSVSISAQAATVLGSIIVPGGSITIKGASSSDLIFGTADNAPLATVYMGPGALLSTAGTTVLTPDVYGYPTGSVLPGGSITISGNIVAAAGATLDVSGASGLLYLPQSETTLVGQEEGSFLGAPVAPFQLQSNGGTITLSGAQELFSDATLVGNAGGSAAVGGSLTVSSGLYFPPGGDSTQTPTDPTLVITQSGRTIPGATGIGQAVLGSNNQTLAPNGAGHIAVDSFQGGGFDNVALAGTVQFDGNVSVTAGGELSVASGGVIIADGAVNLTAPYVVLGLPFQGPLTPEQQAQSPFNANGSAVSPFGPTSGAGSLTVTADLIDVGNLSLQGISNVNLIALNGDIRGDGTLDLAGHITLTAGQVYPASDVTFEIAAYDENIVVASSQSGGTQVTLASAALPPGFGVGSPLLGSTVQSIDGTTVTLASGANISIGTATAEVFAPGSGSVTIRASGSRQLPLSAGGTLDVYASNIDQDGVLRAPMGTINLGWNGSSGTAPTDPITGAPVDSTLTLTLGSQSVTSVSAVDPLTGKALIIPYGSNPTGTAWIDPAGNNITAGGIPEKTINIGAASIDDQAGSVVDLKGGGDLSSYRFVAGEGGSTDFLSPGVAWSGASYTAGQLVSYKGATWVALQQTTTAPPAINGYWSQVPASYAVVPGYTALYAPYAPFNSITGDPGYTSAGLQVGEQVYLGSGSGLTPGIYTLLPARYALLPGAYLVTPETGTPVSRVTLPDGSNIVSGYLFNGLSNSGGLSGARISQFQVDSQSVILSRGQYDTYVAGDFLRQGAEQSKVAVPLLPVDAGVLNFDASTNLVLQGMVEAEAPAGGITGFVDINSTSDITITSGATGPAGTLTLDSSELSSFGAGTLLIGGILNADGTTIDVETNNIEVNNAGSPLTGADVILVANNKLTLDSGAEIASAGASTGQPKALAIQDTTDLDAPGATLAFAQGGVPIAFPQGTPGNDTLTATVGGTITLANGETTTFSAGNPFTLAAGSSITLNPGGGTISFSGGTAGSIPVSLGDGALVRVSSDSAATISRYGVASSEAPDLTVGAGARIIGAGVILNSTYAASLDPSAVILGHSVTLGSGQISIELNNPGIVQSSQGFVLGEGELGKLSGAQSLSLLSYSSIDIYGSGQVGLATLANLSLDAAEIEGFNNGGNPASFDARNILLDNSAGGTAASATTPVAGTTLEFNAGTIDLGSNQIDINQFATVDLNATGGILSEDTSGITVAGALNIAAPVITGAAGSNETISAGGALNIAGIAGGHSTVTGGLGAAITLSGASVTDNSGISAQSGHITLNATTGDVNVGNLVATTLDAGGASRSFFDLTKYTSGGELTLISDQGNVDIGKDATLDVAAQAGGGNAGTLSVTASHGSFKLAGTLSGKGGTGGEYGTFSLDAGTIPGGDLSLLDDALAAGGFTHSVSIRDRDDSNITVSGIAKAQAFTLSADIGSITVTGEIDASGATGGTIDLIAAGSLTLDSGALLTVAGQNFNSAGQGGSVSLEADAYTGGSFTNVALGTGPQLNIAAGSTIDLSVAANTTAAATAANAALGLCNGTLLIAAPQALGNTDLQVAPIDGNIKNASSIIVEGVQVFDATDGSVDNQEGNVFANGQTFVGAAGSPATASYTAMINRLFANNMSVVTPGNGTPAVAVIEPGAEIVNPSGDLTLASDWDLANSYLGAFRFGPNSAPGVLTLRASGNLIFNGALSDGFNASPGSLWEATLMIQNTALPVNAQDWSYNLTAGADFSGANVADVLPVSNLDGSGSVELGINDPYPYASQSGPNGTISSAVSGYYQVIRTGAGNINVAAGSNVELLNQFATIYTAGTQVVDPTMGGTFSVPILDESQNPSNLGTGPFFGTGYPAQYSEAGGNVTIYAQQDIEHLTQDVNGNLVMDSESELPDNWLYRRGDVAATGLFDSNPNINFSPTGEGDPSESTTWWVDFSNFFEGVGALGGGNVTMVAGGDIANVDAVVPTNARMPGIGSTGNLAPNAASLVQLGGGYLLVQAGNDINAGVYYVGNGEGTLIAGNQILTNSTRAPVGGMSSTSGDIPVSPDGWLPTTLFAGDASFNVTAGQDLLLGPVANPFLLPEGFNNSVWYKTYFSTYGTGDSVDVTSVGGSITLREYASSSLSGPILQVWLDNMDLMGGVADSRAYYQPWLTLNEESVVPFGTVSALMPPTLNATSFSGDINVVGSLLLSPSPTGTLDLTAAGSINGFQSLGQVSTVVNYTEATIDLSDSDPASIPAITSPFGYQEVAGVGTSGYEAGTTGASTFLAVFSDLFDATTTGVPGVIETEQALHDSSILHAADSTPVYLYAATGAISGVDLYSPTATRIAAAGDITDFNAFLQNTAPTALSVISAGADIVPYDPTSPEREAALANPEAALPVSLAGDIQVAGPGTLEVLAGGNLNLGGQGPGGASNTTGDGISSIGNALNPALPFAGADIVAAAGIGGSVGLGQSELNFPAFISQFIDSPAGATYLGELNQIASFSAILTPASFNALSQSEQDLLALDVFYLVLRDAGRDHNDAASTGYGNYDAGLAAIATLFPNSGPGGDIDVTSRDIKTESGGNISLLAPGGQVTVGLNSSAGDDVTNLGIVTQDGGNISIFTNGDVNVGTSRIFTLRGGNEIIWSSNGNIDAGASSKTVQSAPPTRVLVDPQSANVQTDLAGLATGGGIGVLASVMGVAPGNVDLIAPTGFVNAGEAGIRATGNLNIAAVAILNAGNISVGGLSTGLPPAIAAPNIAGLAAASSAAGSSIGAADTMTQQQNVQTDNDSSPSVIFVQVLGYGGGDGSDDTSTPSSNQPL